MDFTQNLTWMANDYARQLKNLKGCNNDHITAKALQLMAEITAVKMALSPLYDHSTLEINNVYDEFDSLWEIANKMFDEALDLHKKEWNSQI